jgi:hypothetical protein
MASQKLTNRCEAAIALPASTYVFGAFCLAFDIDAFLRKHQPYLLCGLQPGKEVHESEA